MNLSEAEEPRITLEERCPSFGQLYREHHPWLVKQLRRMGLDGQAEDVAHDAFLKLAAGWEAIDHSQAFRPLLRKTARNLWIDRCRREKRQTPTDSTDSILLLDRVEQPPDIESRLVVAERLQRLPEAQLEAVRLHYLEDRTYAEAARVLDVSINVVKQRVHRARLALEPLLKNVLGAAILPLQWLKRAGEAVDERARRTGVKAHAEHLLSASAHQVVSAVAALVVVLGGVPAPAIAKNPPSPPRPAIAEPGTPVAKTRQPRSPKPRAVAPAGGSEGQPSTDGGGGGPKRLAEDTLHPNQDVAQPEDANMTSIVASPRYSQDGVLLAAGTTSCHASLCPNVLFRSGDGGRTWVRLEGRDFRGESLLLPPAFGAGDDRVFAMGPHGLQVSEDGGRSFRAAATAGATDTAGSAAISPGFDSGDPTILIGGRVLMSYRDDTRSIEPVPSNAAPGPFEPAFPLTHPQDPRFLVAALRVDEELQQPTASLYTCQESLCSWAAVSTDNERPSIRLTSGYSEGGVVHVFTSSGVYVSHDWGRNFEGLPRAWGEGVAVRDLAMDEASGSLFVATRGYQESLEPPHPESGLFVWKLGGMGWQQVQDPLLARGARVVMTAGRLVLAGLADGGIACSGNEGLTWARRCP